jgi:RNA polymerase sigma-70 factor (ECF subfamily)
MKIEENLLKECIQNKGLAQKKLYECCFPYLMSICRLYSSDDQEAMSLLNNGFYKILKGLRKRKTSVPFRPWCRRVLINSIIDEFKKHKKKKKDEFMVGDWSPDLENQTRPSLNLADLMFDAEEVVRMIRKLPEMSSKVFNLYALESFSYAEIAEMLNISESTARWHVSSARKKLMRMIQLQQPEKKIKHGIARTMD